MTVTEKEEEVQRPESIYVLHLIFECVRAFSHVAPQNLKDSNAEKLKEVLPSEYFVLKGRTEKGILVLTPKEVYLEVLKAKMTGFYNVFATQAMLMFKVCSFLFSKSIDLGPLRIFLDPRRVILILCAQNGFREHIKAVPPMPFAFDFCFPFGKTLQLYTREREGELDLNLKLLDRDLFLNYQIEENINKAELHLFTKIRAHVLASVNVFDITIRTFKLQSA